MSATILIGAVCLFIAIACAIFLSRRHAVGRGANNIPGPQEPPSNAFLGRSKNEGVAESSKIPQDAKQTIEGQRKGEELLAPIKIASGAEALAVPHATEETIEHQQLDQELIAPVKIASTTEIPAAVDDVQERVEHHGARVNAAAAIAQSATEILAEVQATPPDAVPLTDLKGVGPSPASDLDSPPLESQQTPESDGSNRSSVEPETRSETSKQHVDDDEAREFVSVEADIDSSCPKNRQDRKQGNKKQRERAPASTQTAESTSKSLFDPNAQPAGVKGGQAAAAAAIGNKQTEEIETAKSPVESTLAQQPPRRDPRRYRPRIGITVKSASQKRSRKTAKAPTERTLSIKVRVLFERDGSCHVSLLPEKSASLPDSVEVSGTLGALRLIILQEDFYQDVILADVGTALRTGIELHDTSGSQWSLSGRDIFVFGPGRLRGFVSMPRLVISDEEQLVLCATNLRDEVEDVLRVIGCTPDILDASSGVPTGWLLFRGARPKKTVPVTPDDSILNVIRPEPLIEIELAGGIRLRQSEWITEFPPEIHMRGEIDSSVSIDNIPATIDAERRYHRQGWDLVGHHVVSCAGVSRSYSIVDPEDRSEPWPAYVMGGAASDGSAICGAAVLAPNSSKVGNMLWVPVGTPLLLGANAGEVFRFFPRTDVSSETWPVSVPFTVVWALPAQPLRANKALARVLLFGKAVPPGHLGFSPKTSVTDQRPLLDWARAILNSTRKGLSVEPRTPEVRNLWTEYHRLARQIWKLSR